MSAPASKGQLPHAARSIKKTSYPVLVSVAGFGLVIFMVTFVVPQFRDVFSASGVKLPLVTRVVSGVSEALLHNWLWIIGSAFLAVVSLIVLRSQTKGRIFFDSTILRIPILGGWIRDASALQFTDSVMAMIESGFTPVEAVEIAVPCVRNRAVRQAVMQVCLAVRRGERLSKEMARFPNLFPATLCQLIHVGEQSGDFSQAMVGASRHLRYQLERRIDGSISLIEPILTLGLRCADRHRGDVDLYAYVPHVRSSRIALANCVTNPQGNFKPTRKSLAVLALATVGESGFPQESFSLPPGLQAVDLLNFAGIMVAFRSAKVR